MELNVIKIKKELKRVGWKQSDLAWAMGVHRAWVTETFKNRKNLTFRTVNKIAKALGMDAKDLVK